MRALTLLTSALFFSCAAEQLNCDNEDESTRHSDETSLLQGRATVEHADDPENPGSSFTTDSNPEAAKAFVIGQRVQRRDRRQDWKGKEDWDIGYVTSVTPLRVSYSDDPDDSHEDGYEWEEVRALPQAHTHIRSTNHTATPSPTFAEQLESDMFTRQIFAQAVHSGWSVGIVATIVFGVLWLMCLGKLGASHVQRREALEKRVASVFTPLPFTEETDVPVQAKQEEGELPQTTHHDLVGFNHYLRGLPQTMKDKLEATVKSVLYTDEAAKEETLPNHHEQEEKEERDCVSDLKEECTT